MTHERIIDNEQGGTAKPWPPRRSAAPTVTHPSFWPEDQIERRSTPKLFRVPEEVFSVVIELTWAPGQQRARASAEAVEVTGTGTRIPVEYWCRPHARPNAPEQLLEEAYRLGLGWVLDLEAPF